MLIIIMMHICHFSISIFVLCFVVIVVVCKYKAVTMAVTSQTLQKLTMKEILKTASPEMILNPLPLKRQEKKTSQPTNQLTDRPTNRPTNQPTKISNDNSNNDCLIVIVVVSNVTYPTVFQTYAWNDFVYLQ